MKLGILSLLLSLAAGLPASPLHGTVVHVVSSKADHDPHLNMSTLRHIAPTMSDCKNALYPNECTPGHQALKLIKASFEEYGIGHPAVKAALVAVMAHESDGFQYNVNHWPSPGDPTRGTKNMQSSEFNVLYAKHVGIPDGEWNGNRTKLCQLVGVDKFTFNTAAWFMKYQCDSHYRTDLWGSSASEAFEDYVENCLYAGGSDKDGLMSTWQRASQVYLPTTPAT